MNENPIIKPPKAFDAANLILDESFTALIKRRTGSLPEDDPEAVAIAPRTAASNETLSFKTGGAVHSGCVMVPNPANREIFACANIRGEIFFFEQKKTELAAVSKVTLQGAIYTSPVFSGGILYSASREGTVYAVDTGLGSINAETDGIRNSLLWQKKMKKGILAEPVITEKYLLVAPLDGIYAFDISRPFDKNSGVPVWGVSINGTVSTPVLDEGMLYIGSEDRRLFGFDCGGSTPKKTWDYELSGSCRMRPLVSRNGGYVAAATTDGFIYAVDKNSGSYKWSFAVKSPVISNIIPGKTAGGEYLYFGSDAGVFFCLDFSGRCVWRFNAGGKIRTEPVIHNGLIWFGSEDNTLYALDMVTGRELFRYRAGGGIYGRPLLLRDRVYFGSTDGCIYSINF